MQTYHFLAIDLGASSGRAILGFLSDDRVEMKEIHRFPNEMIEEDGHAKWDVEKLHQEVLHAIKICVDRENIIPHCIGIDSWGVDVGLLDTTGKLKGKPFAYRDHYTDDAIEQVTAKIEARELYQQTGTQFLQFNTLFQLWSMKKKYPELLLSIDQILFIPDLLSFFLTRSSYSEYTIASTAQMLDPTARKWNMQLLHKLGIPTHTLQDIVYPGTVIGNLVPELQARLGIGPVPVAAVAAHDTASAIAAIPASGDDWAYLSSGTWSLLGVELDQPCLSQEAFEADFTNEGGVDGTIRFLKNINGLWLLQGCKKNWDQQRNYSFSELADLSLKAAPFQSLIDPDDAAFLNPADMQFAIEEYCRKTKQPVPEGIPAFTRTIFESLALKYLLTLEKLMAISGKEINRIHLIGGGSQNKVLCQFTANATGKEVIAGPTEGTALGNILMQAKAMGLIDHLHDIREIVKQNVVTKSYLPKQTKKWQAAAIRFKEIISINSLSK